MPDALEFPGVRRTVIPLVCTGFAVIHKLVTDRRPGFATVI